MDIRDSMKNRMKSGSVQANVETLTREGDSIIALSAQITRKRCRMSRLSHNVVAKIVNPNATAFRYPVVSIGSAPNMPVKASIKGNSGGLSIYMYPYHAMKPFPSNRFRAVEM